jgi:putative hydrolase of HD superfamily
MKVKAPPPLSRFDGEQLSPLLELYLEMTQLKQLYRQGWLRRGIAEEHCETVAEHTFGVAALALFLLDAHFPQLDRDKVLRMALLHDFGEIHAGDLTPADGIPVEEKQRREERSVERVLAGLPGAERYLELWSEYAAGASPEAQFVRQVDRLEMVLQAAVYERQRGADLSEFYASVDEELSAVPLRDLLAELRALRAD